MKQWCCIIILALHFKNRLLAAQAKRNVIVLQCFIFSTIIFGNSGNNPEHQTPIVVELYIDVNGVL